MGFAAMARNKPRCGARTRKGRPCRRRLLLRGGKCPNHGGMSTGPLHGWGISVLALNCQSFDLGTASGKLMRTIIAGMAEFERNLIRERVKSGLARAKAAIEKDCEFVTKSGKVCKKLGRKAGYRPSDQQVKKVLELAKDGLSYRLIGRNLGLS